MCRRRVASVMAGLVIVGLTAVPAAFGQPKPVEPPAPAAAAAESPMEPGRQGKPTTAQAFEAKEPPLGPPLVTNPEQLRRLDPDQPVWIDPARKQLVLIGTVCNTAGPLELFACLAKSKEYESVVAVPCEAKLVHAGLLAVGVEPGHGVRYEPFEPPAGPPISILLVWSDKQGKRHTSRAQQWLRRIGTQQAMEHAWVFAGSRMVKDEEGNARYAADITGELITVSNFPDALLDVPTRSTTNDSELLFEAFTERIPPRGTQVTLILSAEAAEAKRGVEKKLLR